jgi:hypothetical protein
MTPAALSESARAALELRVEAEEQQAANAADGGGYYHEGFKKAVYVVKEVREFSTLLLLLLLLVASATSTGCSALARPRRQAKSMYTLCADALSNLPTLAAAG